MKRMPLLIMCALAVAGPVRAGTVFYTLPVFESVAQDHWPGPDGLIGNADDWVDQNLSPVNLSEWNRVGSLSYNAFDFVGDGSVSEPERLPSGMNAVTFLSGQVMVDTDVARFGGGPLVTQWDLGGTEPFFGHGSYSSLILQVNSGSYDPITHAFVLNMDFQANLQGGGAIATGFEMTGEAYWVDRSEFAGGTGNAYVDGVLIPIAEANGANSLVFIRGGGIVPASSGGTGGSFPQMPIEAVIVGTSSFMVDTDSGSWGRVKSLYAN